MPIYALGSIQPTIDETAWVAPDANVIGDIALHAKSSVWFGATLRGDNETITLGQGSNIQENCVLHTDMGYPLVIGENCTIGHKVTLHGCVIGDNSLIGIGATVLNGAKIGKNCLIGAHALIGEGKEIPDNSMVLGMPGKIVRTLEEGNRAIMQAMAEHYVENWKRY